MSTKAKATPIPHALREFNHYPGSAYILPSDQKEAERLELQHKVLREAYDGKVLLCPFTAQDSYFVLDSGVGCGSWILDIASQLSPSSLLHGIDIESRLLPRTQLLPQTHPLNISFSLTSILTLPDGWKGKFNIVHQRLLLGALRRSEWPIALAQMYRVLQPGGWVQLGEFGSWHAGPITERHARMHRETFKARGLDRDIAHDLPALLRAAGFTGIRVEKREIPLGAWAGRHGLEARNNHISVFRAMKTAVLQAGGLGFVSSEEEFDQLIDTVEKEWDETEGAGMDFHIIYAQRPTNPKRFYFF